MTLEEAQRRLVAAARYRDVARYLFDARTRAALIDTAVEFERMAWATLALPGNDRPFVVASRPIQAHTHSPHDESGTGPVPGALTELHL